MDDVVIVHTDERTLMRLTATVSRTRFSATAVRSLRPLQSARQLLPLRPAAMVVALDGHANVTDVRELLASGRPTRFVFVVPAMPPPPAVARLVKRHGSTIIGADEAAIVLVATLIALLAAHSVGAP
ncbi:MAG: hypothetical protein KGK07_02065 [Chloroflexota bacterium]|nr:hypothetical protein [Chloroflexota bacterium]